jgi:hypothetical protein
MEAQINRLKVKVKGEYVKFCSASGRKDVTGYFAQQLADFDKNIGIRKGPKYTKIIRDGSVWGFIVNEDGPRFKKGDILKAASWQAPATNSPRGNIFDDDYSVEWTGPHYLK